MYKKEHTDGIIATPAMHRGTICEDMDRDIGEQGDRNLMGPIASYRFNTQKNYKVVFFGFVKKCARYIISINVITTDLCRLNIDLSGLALSQSVSNHQRLCSVCVHCTSTIIYDFFLLLTYSYPINGS